MQGHLTFYHNPRSRSAMARWMLEEVGADYTVVPVSFEAGDNRRPEFLAINPLGKIPAIVLPDGTVLTETPAIIAWLAEAYPEAGLAPEKGSSKAGVYYRWLFFGGSCFEPAMTEAMMRKDAPPLPKASIGWGDFADVVGALEAAVLPGPYLLGDTFSAADLYIGAQLSFAGMFKAPGILESPSLQAYVARVTDRPAYRAAMQG